MAIYQLSVLISADSDEEALTKLKLLNIDTARGEVVQALHTVHGVEIPPELLVPQTPVATP